MTGAKNKPNPVPKPKSKGQRLGLLEGIGPRCDFTLEDWNAPHPEIYEMIQYMNGTHPSLVDDPVMETLREWSDDIAAAR
jgi:hypothetical protein